MKVRSSFICATFAITMIAGCKIQEHSASERRYLAGGPRESFTVRLRGEVGVHFVGTLTTDDATQNRGRQRYEIGAQVLAKPGAVYAIYLPDTTTMGRIDPSHAKGAFLLRWHNPRTGRWVSVRRPVEPGTEYRFEVWGKTEGVSGQAYAHLAWQRGTKWLSETATERVSGTSDWRKLTVSAVAPAEADTVVVSLNLSRSKGTAWFDDVKLSGKSNVLPKTEYVFHDTESWFSFEFPLNDTVFDLPASPEANHHFIHRC